jgi:two-component system phosphate regulon response regulator OmpR
MNQSILVVDDDDPVLRALVCDYLQGRGFQAVALAHGVALQHTLHDERPAPIVLAS